MKWEPWFAWHPVIMQNGRVAWLRKILRRWNPELGLDPCFSAYVEPSGEWEYRG